MPILFAYGSMLSPQSVSRTLRRPIALAQMTPCSIVGFRRTWTALVRVYVGSGEQPVDALFLDITESPGARCNGAVIDVSDDELTFVDARERGYIRHDVAADIDGRIVSAIAYMVPAQSKRDDGYVMENYVSIVEDALRLYSPTFVSGFRQSTDEPPRPLMPGDYVFSPRDVGT